MPYAKEVVRFSAVHHCFADLPPNVTESPLKKRGTGMVQVLVAVPIIVIDWESAEGCRSRSSALSRSLMRRR